MMRRPLAVLLSFSVALLSSLTTSVAAAPAPISGDGERLLGPNGQPLFLLGMNYEGPADRAWEMWADGKFDRGLIAADFARAKNAGVNALRVFVQAPLAKDIAAGKWDKLDAVVGLAETSGIQLIVTLYDYSERDLARVAATAGQVAARYRGRPGVLAYDLRNEPRFGDLALSIYKTPPVLQTPGPIAVYGERLPRARVAEYRASPEGAKEVPKSLSDDQAWVYVNNLRLYRELLAEAGAWVRQKGFTATSLDYLDDPAGAKWQPFMQGLDDTLRAWLEPQVAAVRKADPTRPITVAHVDPILARLSSNSLLDYQTLHRYPGTGAAAVRAALSLVGAVQKAQPGRPFVLGEFGYANEKLDAAKGAIHETALLLGLLGRRAAGGLKWMVNDMPEGYNMRERTLGAFTLEGQPKPVVAVMAQLRAYLQSSGSAPGELKLEDEPEQGLRYVYRASDAVLLGGTTADAGVVRMTAQKPSQLFLTMMEPGQVRLWASERVDLDVDLGALMGTDAARQVALSRADGGAAVPLKQNGARATMTLEAGTSYRLLSASVSPRAADYDVTGGRFFTQTNGRPKGESGAGFTVNNEGGVPFWDTFRELGGVTVLGYPVTRRFQLDGFWVQAFQKGVLQWRPDQGNRMLFLNTFDVLSERGKDDWLESARQTPRPFDTAPDAGLTWPQVVQRHLGFLDRVPPPLKQRFTADPQWLDRYGLPVAVQEYPNSVVVRAQRATFQYWKEAVPWAAKGDITVANGGDLAKEAGLWPWLASTPENAPR